MPDVSARAVPEPPGDGQPRPAVEEAPRRPSAAERARTLLEGNRSLAAAIPGLAAGPEGPPVPLRHSVGPSGDVFLLLPRGEPAVRAARNARDGELAAVLEVTDVAPVAVPRRIRGRARVAGRLTPVPGGGYEAGTELLRLEPGEISVDDLWGAALVEPDEFAAAAPDPLAGCETQVLQHLAAAHARRSRCCAGPPGWPGPAGRVRVGAGCRWRWTASGCASGSPAPGASSTSASTSPNR
jgi:hypothetical protein